MNVLIHRFITATFLISLVFFGCGGGEGDNNIENGEYPDGDIEMFIWETNGGGDILFSITRVDNQFEILVERYNFQDVNVSILLTDTDAEVFGLVEDIFNKIIDINDYAFTPQGDTGTWTKIILEFTENQKVEIENIKVADDELRTLYDYVIENTEQIA